MAGGQKTSSKAASTNRNHYQMAHFNGSGAQTLARSSQLYQPTATMSPFAGAFYAPPPSTNYALVEPYYSALQQQQQQQQHLSLTLRPQRRRAELTQETPANYLASALEQQARLALAPANKPLCRCRVMYLGSSVPHITKNGLHGIQEPLKHLYPEEQFCSNVVRAASTSMGAERTTIDISHLSARLGIDSWLSVWSNGLLLENVDEFGREVRRFFAMDSLHYCAAVRYFDTINLQASKSLPATASDPNNNNNHAEDNEPASGNQQEATGATLAKQRHQQTAARFLPLDAPIFKYPGMLDASHPPVFASIMRRTQGIKVLECHAFICRRDAAANALVRCCTHAYADFLSAKRLSAELASPNNCYMQPNFCRADQLGSAMTLPNRQRAQSKPLIGCVAASAKQRSTSAKHCRSGSSTRRHISSMENSAAATSSSAPSDHSLQSSSAADDDNYAIITKQAPLDQRRTRRASSKSKARLCGSSRSLFNDFQPPPVLGELAPSVERNESDSRLSHSLDYLAANVHHMAANKQQMGSSNDLDTSSELRPNGGTAKQQRHQMMNGVQYSLVERPRANKRHSKSMQNLVQTEQVRKTSASKQAAHLQETRVGAIGRHKSRRAASCQNVNAPQESSAASCGRRHSKRRQRHRSEASSAVASSPSPDATLVQGKQQQQQQQQQQPVCMACPPVEAVQQRKSSSRRARSSDKSTVESATSTLRRLSCTEENELLRQQVAECNGCLRAAAKQRRLPPLALPQAYYGPAGALHYAALAQQHQAQTPQQAAFAAGYCAQAYAIAPQQPIYEAYYAAPHPYAQVAAAAGPLPPLPAPPAPPLKQQQQQQRAQPRVQSVQLGAFATLGRQARALSAGCQRQKQQQQQQLALHQGDSDTKQASQTLAARFRCLSPPVNLLWGQPTRGGARSSCRRNSDKRHSNSTTVGGELSGCEQSSSRPTSELLGAAQASCRSPQLAPDDQTQANRSASQQSALGERLQEAFEAPAVVVSARPGFKQQQQQQGKARSLGWIKRLSLSIGGSPRSESVCSAARHSAEPAGAELQVAQSSEPSEPEQVARGQRQLGADRTGEQASGERGASSPEQRAKGHERHSKQKKHRLRLFAAALTRARSSRPAENGQQQQQQQQQQPQLQQTGATDGASLPDSCEQQAH